MKSFPTFKTRTVVCLVAASISLLLAAPAQALTIKGSSTDRMVHINKPKKDVDLRIRSADGRSVVPLIDAGEQVAYVQVGSTGQGDSEEECNDRGDLINSWLGLVSAALAWGDAEGDAAALNASANILEEEEAALDAGCFIVYKQGPPPEPEPEVG